MDGSPWRRQTGARKEGGNMSFDWTILHWIQNTLVCPALRNDRLTCFPQEQLIPRRHDQ